MDKQFLDAYSVMFIILGILATCGSIVMVSSLVEDFNVYMLCSTGFILLLGIGCIIFGTVTIVKKHK